MFEGFALAIVGSAALLQAVKVRTVGGLTFWRLGRVGGCVFVTIKRWEG